LTDAEDYDFARRALKEGIDVSFDKSNIAIHHDPVTCKSYVLRQRQYTLAHEKLLLLGHQNLSEHTSSILKKIVYRFFAFPFWISFIDESRLIKIFPQVIRYKFYGLVIHALGKEFRHIPLK
jgi:hypothetical protein